MSPTVRRPVVSGDPAESVRFEGFEAIARFDDVADEVGSVRDACGLADATWRAVVRATGEDRVDFLHRMVSNSVEGRSPGDGLRALLLTNKGKILADLDVWVGDDDVRIGCDVRAVDDLLETLRKFVLASRVEFEDLRDETAVLSALGPRADDLLSAAGASLPEPGSRTHGPASIDGVEVHLARDAGHDVDGLEIHVPREDAAGVWEILEDRGADLGVDRFGWEADEVLRVEAGRPRHGAEITGDELPQEIGCDDAVDLEKGCYPGQETVARIHYRGQVNRHLVGLRLPRALEPGWRLRAADRQVGKITSVATSPKVGPIALGFVRREHGEEGTELELEPPQESGGSREKERARVADLPFATEDGT